MAQDPLNNFPVFVLGGSAGSIDVLLQVTRSLPPGTGSVFIIVLHRKNDKDSILLEIISNKTNLPVREVEDKEPITVNTVFIAPADYHLLVENEKYFSLDGSEKIQYSRPSIDVTFESVAEVFRERVTGIILSGANSDGADGLDKIKKWGGLTIAQDPATAEVSFMPQQAINKGVVDKIIPANDLPSEILKILQTR